MRAFGPNRVERERREISNLLTSFVGGPMHVGTKIKATQALRRWLDYLNVNDKMVKHFVVFCNASVFI